MKTLTDRSKEVVLVFVRCVALWHLAAGLYAFCSVLCLIVVLSGSCHVMTTKLWKKELIT